MQYLANGISIPGLDFHSLQTKELFWIVINQDILSSEIFHPPIFFCISSCGFIRIWIEFLNAMLQVGYKHSSIMMAFISWYFRTWVTCFWVTMFLSPPSLSLWHSVTEAQRHWPWGGGPSDEPEFQLDMGGENWVCSLGYAPWNSWECGRKKWDWPQGRDICREPEFCFLLQRVGSLLR